MPSYRLQLNLPKTVSDEKARTTFFWPYKGVGSFESTCNPDLSELGSVRYENIDLVRIAAVVYAADRTTLRRTSSTNWRARDIEVEVPIINLASWRQAHTEFESLLGFLTGDSWKLRFKQAPTPQQQTSMLQAGAKRVVLLSGGADSASGALISRAELGNQEQILVSHRGSKPIAPIQRDVAEAVRASVSGGSQQHIQVGFLRRKKQPNGYNFRNESSTRSRSLLFLAFGLAVASVEELPLWIPENGFASLNPPLGPERRGSLSTRTTHPYFLSELKAILDSVGAHSNFTNPFEDLTKGEMFRRVAEIVGKDVAADVLSKTHSCSTANQRFSRTSTKIQCGVCFSCVIRRSSFMAAGLEDGTEYMDGSADASIQKWLDDRSIDRSMRDFLRRGIQAKDITSMPLPRYYSRSDALELCRKGQEEIRRLYT